MRKLSWARALILTAGGPLAASACPDCAAGIRTQVRHGIFDTGFGANLLAAALPFAVFAGVAALLHAGVPFDRPLTGRPPEPPR